MSELSPALAPFMQRVHAELQGVWQRVVDAPDAGSADENEQRMALVMALIIKTAEMYLDTLMAGWAHKGKLNDVNVAGLRAELRLEFCTRLSKAADALVNEIQQRRP